MAHRYILDTHALVWFLEGNKRLGKQAKAVISDPESQMVMPLIGLAEAVYIIEKGRTTIPDVPRFLDKVFARALTPEGKRIPELHDRFIVSTGLHLQDTGDTIEIITRDETITEAAVLPVLW